MAKKESKKLDELFHDTLKDIYFAEKKILTVLPKMEKDLRAVEPFSRGMFDVVDLSRPHLRGVR